MKLLAILAMCSVTLTLFLVQADVASADGRYGSGGSTTTQRGRGAQSSGTAARGQTYQQQRGQTQQQRGQTQQQRGQAYQQRGTTGGRGAGTARPARAGEFDLVLVAGALGGLGLLAVVGGQTLRRRGAVA